MRLVDITDREIEQLEKRLACYDQHFTGGFTSGTVSIGIRDENDTLIAGLDATMTSFNILYVSTLFVDEHFRRRGLGRKLVNAMEERARKIGAHSIRLDTFNWQGVDFYKALGYQEVGSYHHPNDEFSEHFFVKFLH